MELSTETECIGASVVNGLSPSGDEGIIIRLKIGIIPPEDS